MSEQKQKIETDEQNEIYKNLYEICKEINQNYISHLGDLVSKAKTYLSFLNLLTVLLGLSIFQVTDLFTKSEKSNFEILLIGTFAFTLFVIFMNIFFLAMVLGTARIETYPDPSEIIENFSKLRLVDFFASMATHFQKITKNNKTIIKQKETFSVWSSRLLYVCLISFLISVSMTFAWKVMEVKMSDQDKTTNQQVQPTEASANPKEDSVVQATKPPQPVKVVDLKADIIKKTLTGTCPPKTVQTSPGVLKFSEDKAPNNLSPSMENEPTKK